MLIGDLVISPRDFFRPSFHVVVMLTPVRVEGQQEECFD